MKKKSLITVACLFMVSLLSASPFTIPADDTFYHPNIKSYRKIIAAPNNDDDHSNLIQSAIDEVNSNGGGILFIEAVENNAIYNITEGVKLKSNVHIRVRSNVIFKTDAFKKSTLFSAGKSGDTRITNFSMSCSDSTGFFTFDFTERTAGLDHGGAIGVNIGAASNFRIADIRFKDNLTKFSCITINLLEYNNSSGETAYMFAKNGIFEHLRSRNGHYGYGLIQCQAANNLLFRNLKGEGGATLRLETGAIGKANLIDRNVRLNMIYAKKIDCKNGQAALTLSPHTVNNGKVFVDDLTANSCEAGAIIAAGFLSKRKSQRDTAGNPIDGYVFGFFNKASVVSNLKVTYGTTAQLRSVRRNFVPCNQRGLINTELNPDEESYQGPTVAGIIYSAKEGTARDSGFYTVNTPNLILENFPTEDGVMENKEYVTTPEVNGTRNCPSLSRRKNTAVKTDNKRIYVDYTAGALIVNAELGSKIKIFNTTGLLIKSVKQSTSNVTTIPTSKLKGRFCIVKVKNGANSLVKKIKL